MKLVNETATSTWHVRTGIRFVSVEVKCHKSAGDFIWCWYLNITQKHIAFNDIKTIESLPFHLGQTYSKTKTEAHNFKSEESWCQPLSYLSVGCDYHHLYDDHLYNHAPEFGIPREIENNIELVLLEFKRSYNKQPSHYQSVYSNGAR